MPRYRDLPPNAGVEEAIEQLSDIEYVHPIAGLEPQIRGILLEQVAQQTRVKNSELEPLFRRSLRGEVEDMRVFCRFVANLTNALYLTRLSFNLRDMHAELLYDSGSDDVQIKIWIYASNRDFICETVARSFQFILDMQFAMANERQQNWDGLRLVWLLWHDNETWSPEGTRWESQSHEHKPLSNCVKGFPTQTLDLGWFTRQSDSPKSWLREKYAASQAAERDGRVL
ncbi:hypothetical protein F4801DRAFT_78788 [Xylaria longipes]|nr:hypothetical protein F4801DRAFT_78788 [Xylaria longipes]